jgi:DNA repair protein RecN (Recombination protein N)
MDAPDARELAMLTRLAISNFATIESLSVEFLDGFSVLTGETGAGKSILIGALRLVLGARSSPDQIRAGATQTWVEDTFDLTRLPEVRAQLEELGIPAKDELVVRRTLQDSGRSRALANDCSITQAKLEEIGAYLVSIHGQHDNQMLLDTRTHVDFLDAFAGLLPQRAELKAAHGQYHATLNRLRQLEQKAERQDVLRRELHDQVGELEAARLQPGEEEELRQSLQILTHAEELAELTSHASDLLSDREGSLLIQLQKLAQLLAQAAALDPALAGLHGQVASPHIQLDELYRALRAYMVRLEPDPGRLERAQARLAELEKIKRRYGGSIVTALAKLDAAKSELEALTEIGDAVAQAKAEMAELAAQLHAQAVALSQHRSTAATHLDLQIERQLNELSMNKARFETRIEHADASADAPDAITAQGLDRVEFLLSTNAGQPPRPLARIASGGELSRTMLGMKTILADVDPTRTLIFDEVDAGIGGAVAEIVGNKLRALGTGRQVLCITHLPQIAAQGTHHLRVTKSSDGAQTYTTLVPLMGQEKVQEVARLLSGVTVTAHSLASAEEMVNRGNRASG